jgi:hypothetical protein
MSRIKSDRTTSSRTAKNVQPSARSCKVVPQKGAVNERRPVTKVGGSNSMRQMRNVFEAILKYGHDEDFSPSAGDEFYPTEAPAGSKEKLDVLAERVLRGEPLWHPDDRPDYSGLTGAVRPRE